MRWACRCSTRRCSRSSSKARRSPSAARPSPRSRLRSTSRPGSARSHSASSSRFSSERWAFGAAAVLSFIGLVLVRTAGRRFDTVTSAVAGGHLVGERLAVSPPHEVLDERVRRPLVAPGAAGRRVRREHDAWMVPQPASLGRRLLRRRRPGSRPRARLGRARCAARPRRSTIRDRRSRAPKSDRSKRAACASSRCCVSEPPGAAEHDDSRREAADRPARPDGHTRRRARCHPASGVRRDVGAERLAPASRPRCRCGRDRRSTTSIRALRGSRALANDVRGARPLHAALSGSGRARRARRTRRSVIPVTCDVVSRVPPSRSIWNTG